MEDDLMEQPELTLEQVQHNQEMYNKLMEMISQPDTEVSAEVVRELAPKSTGTPLLLPEERKVEVYPFQVFRKYGYNNQILRQFAAPLETLLGDEMVKYQNLLRKMWGLMRAWRGVGLAAPQVGVSKRVVVIDLSFGEYKTPLLMANPIILSRSEDYNMADEGCLSLPNISAQVKRAAWVEVRYIDGNGIYVESERFDGVAATAIQHEIDHLNGVLLIDHMSRIFKEKVLGKYVRMFPRNLATQV
jgi:peptide deformylase